MVNMFKWRITDIKFSDGNSIDLEAGSLLVIVGPNNSGKSTALREIHSQIGQNPQRTVISDFNRELLGTEEEFREWMSANYPLRNNAGQKFYFTKNQQVAENDIANAWSVMQRNKGGYSEVAAFISQSLDTESRLTLASLTRSIDSYRDVPGSYIHMMQQNEKLSEKVSKEARRLFGVDIIINWGGGQNVWLHAGDKPVVLRPNGDPAVVVSQEYLEAINELPRLEQQGDGLRSFIGTLLAAESSPQPILLIDEPEAFLHPTQAQRLGALLAASAEAGDRQIIVSTHSSAFLRGAITQSKKVSVCRLSRAGNVNSAKRLSTAQLSDLWSKPLLRSASAIEGIFYKGVVVCEADADARIYEALMRHLQDNNEVSGDLDIYFVSGGGKGELATLASAYKSLDIPVAVLADLDLLRNLQEFKKVLEALGADFPHMEAKYNTTLSGLNDIPPTKSKDDFINKTKALLDEVDSGGILTSELRIKLSNLLTEAAPWSEAKKHGINRLAGGAHTAAGELLRECESSGLFLVPEGELESWWRGGPANKSDWAREALRHVSDAPGDFVSALTFVKRAATYLQPS
jgi:predicted ATPase